MSDRVKVDKEAEGDQQVACERAEGAEICANVLAEALSLLVWTDRHGQYDDELRASLEKEGVAVRTAVQAAESVTYAVVAEDMPTGCLAGVV